MANGPVLVMGAPNALFGRMIERAGGKAVYLSGAATSAGVLALPDVGLVTLSELAQQTTYLTRRVRIPVIVDADTGFGGPDNVQRTVVELEAAGAAAIQLEDQQFPKRCGHLAGKSLIPASEMAAKIEAAVRARRHADLVLIARTDAAQVTGFEDAVQRAHLYLEAGADWIFPEALASTDQLARFARDCPAPLVANMTEFGQSPLVPLDQLAQLGYSVILLPVTLLRIAAESVETAITSILQHGTQKHLIDRMQTRRQLYDLLDYHPENTICELEDSDDRVD